MSLRLEKIAISFGGLKAVSNFSLALKPRELCGLIGPNGAGKTTIFNLITGVYEADQGDMFLDDKKLTGLPPHLITKSGIARTFQNIRLFGDLSVIDNVRVSYHMRSAYGYASAFLRLPKFFVAEKAFADEAHELLSIFGLHSRKREQARSLSYGDQRKLEIVRALATRPKVLLLDEPAAGLNTQEKAQLMHTIAEIRDRFQVAILVIEHDMKMIMGICERIVVLDHGEPIAEGTPKEIQMHPKVIEAYLGVA